MADVFISYKSERRGAAEYLARILEAYGYSCWYDYAMISGANFGRQIEQQLRSARAVVVLWCTKSIDSEWVLDEAHRAHKQRKLIPLRVEDVELPMGFGQLHTLDLTKWNGSPRTSALDSLFTELARLVNRPPKALTPELHACEAAWRNSGSPRFSQFTLGTALESSGLQHSNSGANAASSRARMRQGIIGLALVAGLGVAAWVAHRSTSEPSTSSLPTTEQQSGPTTPSAETGTTQPVTESAPTPSVVNARLLEPIAELSLAAPIDLATLSPAGNRLLAFSRLGYVSVMELPSGRSLFQTKLVENSGLMPPSFSPDGTRFIAMFHADPSRDAQNGGSGWGIFDAASGKLLGALGDSWVCRVPVFSASGEYVHGAPVYDSGSSAPPMSACETQIWSASDGTLRSDRTEAQMFGGFIGTSRRYLSFERGEKQLRLKSLEPGADPIVKAAEFPEVIHDVLVSPTGDYAAVSLEGSMITVISLPDLKPAYSVYSASLYGETQTPRFTSDGKRLLIRPGVAGREFELVNTATGKAVFRYPNGFYLTNTVYRDAPKGLGYPYDLRFVEGGGPVDFLPTSSTRTWSASIGAATDEALILSNAFPTLIGPQEIYFADLRAHSLSRLAAPAEIVCSSFVFARNYSRTAAICQDGIVRVWQTRKP